MQTTTGFMIDIFIPSFTPHACQLHNWQTRMHPVALGYCPRTTKRALSACFQWPLVQGSMSQFLPKKKTVHPYESLKTEHTRTAQRTRTLLGPPVLGLWFLWKRHLSQQHFAGPIWYRRVWSSAVPSSASRRVTHRSWEAHPDQNSLPYPLKDHIVKTHAVKIDTNIDNLWSQAIDVNGTFTIPYTNITV